MAKETKRVLAIVQMDKSSTPERRNEDMPKILAFLRRFSEDKDEIAFRSNDGLLFGLFLVTSSAHFLQAEFEKCDGTRNGDSFLALEAGAMVGGIGFSRAWTWLQHH